MLLCAMDLRQELLMREVELFPLKVFIAIASDSFSSMIKSSDNILFCCSLVCLYIRLGFFNILYLASHFLTLPPLLSEDSEEADLPNTVTVVFPFREAPLCGLPSCLYSLGENLHPKHLQHLRNS